VKGRYHYLFDVDLFSKNLEKGEMPWLKKRKAMCKSYSRFGNKSISDGPNERIGRKYATNDADDCRISKKEKSKTDSFC